MDAENVFRFFHYAWGVSQRPSLFFSLFHLYTGWFYSISMKESIVKADTISKAFSSRTTLHYDLRADTPC